MFKPVSSKVNFPQMEVEILEFWREWDIFHRTEVARVGGPTFVLYEGPPTANASPGVHHVLARAFKDVIPRYKTMRGFRSLRQAGWDTHGLPVELEVEKALGLSTKQEIEAYGVEAFNQHCRDSVLRYVKEWEELTERIGFWVDMPKAYITFTNEYIETGWWILRQAWDRRLLYQGMKGVPHCPRCVTSLSSHEVALGYEENTPDPSIYVKFLVEPRWWDGGPKPPGVDILFPTGVETQTPTFLLAWTTTPWTLPGNTALAVAPGEEYVVVEVEEGGKPERFILAHALVSQALNTEHRVVTTLRGSELVGLVYRTPYDAVGAGVDISAFFREQVAGTDVVRLRGVEDYTPRVFSADFVSLQDGTGIVHIAPSFGDEDLTAGRENGLAFIQPVDLQGKVMGNFHFSGKFVKDADEDIMKDLKERGLLYRREVCYHTYPFCWRCGTPLLYYAKNSWYIMTTAFKDRLISGNQEINWYPEHIKTGRFGEWLQNNVDWAISRERYWGTPIPIWQCGGCDASHCIGSLEELRERSLPRSLGLLSPERLDLHRPSVDRVVLQCLQCGGEMYRIPEVMDAWFDSGAMPFAQGHVRSLGDLQRLRDEGRFPADYICEAVDQTRGWFYSLHALSILITGEPSYRNVICLGLIQDEKGEKMSKSRGNAVEPWTILNQQGADALRWYLFTTASPGNARRFSAKLVQESLRHFLLTLWNVYSFFVNYANLDSFDPRDAKAVRAETELDRWIISELNVLVGHVTELLDHYNLTDAARRIQEFVDGLSNWYVRRSRRRFWKSENDQDKMAAYVTLHTCLVTVAKLIAPFTPFLAEEMYQNLVRSLDDEAPESVHLTMWPEVDPSVIDEPLDKAVALAMRIASLGRSARSAAGIKVRQPLASLVVKLRSPEEEQMLTCITSQLLDELNVKTVALGEMEITQSPCPGLSIAGDGGYIVAVDTQLTAELADEGLARELVHRLQNLRKAAGLEIADRIITYYDGADRLLGIVDHFSDYIKHETLSEALQLGEPEEGAFSEHQTVDGLPVLLGVKKVG